MLKLYSYFRSSASYRARLGLEWKGLKYEYLPVHLLKDGGQQNFSDYRRVNPMGHVPALDHDGFLVAETMAIFQYLDATFEGPRLFPSQPREHALVMQICEIVNSGIQPLQNLKVGKYLQGELGLAKADADRFFVHWIRDGLANLEKLLERTSGTYALGGEITAADCFIVPQCFSSRRFGVDIAQFPNLARVEANAVKLPAFARAHPEKQPDYAP